ncbi:hypothetical protein [Frankia gtarii]|uniref:hypothetical protein n=1 Tax=Frankia gtarii TaxID=2950102 RepID=UPI0021C1F1C7|nr:hypothetical protein [Frankia gtarii]
MVSCRGGKPVGADECAEEAICCSDDGDGWAGVVGSGMVDSGMVDSGIDGSGVVGSGVDAAEVDQAGPGSGSALEAAMWSNENA